MTISSSSFSSVVSRLQLFRPREYDENLDTLLELVANAELPQPNPIIVEDYRQGKRTLDSDALTLTVDNRSTVASHGRYDMCNFDILSMCDAQCSLTVVRFNDASLRAFIAYNQEVISLCVSILQAFCLTITHVFRNFDLCTNSTFLQ